MILLLDLDSSLGSRLDNVSHRAKRCEKLNRNNRQPQFPSNNLTKNLPDNKISSLQVFPTAFKRIRRFSDLLANLKTLVTRNILHSLSTTRPLLLFSSEVLVGLSKTGSSICWCFLAFEIADLYSLIQKVNILLLNQVHPPEFRLDCIFVSMR